MSDALPDTFVGTSRQYIVTICQRQACDGLLMKFAHVNGVQLLTDASAKVHHLRGKHDSQTEATSSEGYRLFVIIHCSSPHHAVTENVLCNKLQTRQPPTALAVDISK